MKEVTDLIHWWTSQAATAARADVISDYGIVPAEEEAAAAAAVGD